MVAHARGSPSEATRASAFDLRAWIEKVRAAGQLREVQGADPRLEVGAITELNAKRRGPALLFGKFPGYGAGFRILTGAMLNASTLGLTLGIGEKLDTMALTDRVADKLRAIDAQAAEYPV